ncbi:PREDICTED: high affinity immunoglobulin epsilon receptor subunit alpha, partial [Hipposideros armiger]|uniref:high affinity immunoglobulin epsilon receptor subunit alpha n=1 Tax=Hipposideros armiger TaxID=186990 RepID=UPI00093F29A4
NKFLEVNSTTWFHNNTTLAVTNSRLDIIDATTQDSGEYKCQSKNFNPSQSVHLEVFSDWLLIQSSPDVVKEGEPFLLRCHGWMNRNVYKVIYYKNDIAFKYWYENHNISIPKAKLEDSGIYYCSGILWKINYTSDRLNITVQKGL